MRKETIGFTAVLLIFTIVAIFTSAVNKRNLVNIKGPLERDVLRLLQDIPGVTAEPTAFTKRRADIVIRAGDVTHVVEVKAQRLTNAAAARQIAEYAQHLPAGRIFSWSPAQPRRRRVACSKSRGSGSSTRRETCALIFRVSFSGPRAGGHLRLGRAGKNLL